MRKRYTSPLAEMTEVNTLNLIAVSIPGKPNKKEEKDEWADDYDASEYRNDWENIWANI